MAPEPATSNPHPEHPVDPDRRRGVEVTRPNPVWRTDSTSVRLAQGCADRVALVDGDARRARSWRRSNRLEAGFCVDCLEEARQTHGPPEIFKTDQGAPFTRVIFAGVLQREGIAIGMGERGWAPDNLFVERL
ncbi:DDE-type integrase/transposase/recombinase [uncultured Thiocystis sp.]|jgi:putative transposase|uniref:DDE-type integrase/transposase/recombinase n=1 Tax=uncultured Thiocystis sp. TaxID=1202134 RepID=UPI0025FE213B|nr:DDE-type integrase/transposase/recombinase [uncultured Thiocystis sp.]